MTVSDTASIRVETDRIRMIDGVPVVHTELVFRLQDREYRLGGAPFDRENGQGGYTGAFSSYFLKANAHQPERLSRNRPDRLNPDTGFSSTTIYQGDSAAVMEKLLIALDASSQINNNDVAYMALGFIVPAQNCNSVNDSLIKAMGLAYTMPDFGHWAPGAGRMLLPDGWKSKYEGIAEGNRARGQSLSSEQEVALSLLLARTSPKAIEREIKTVNEFCAAQQGKSEPLATAICQRPAAFYNPNDPPVPEGTDLSALARARAELSDAALIPPEHKVSQQTPKPIQTINP